MTFIVLSISQRLKAIENVLLPVLQFFLHLKMSKDITPVSFLIYVPLFKITSLSKAAEKN